MKMNLKLMLLLFGVSFIFFMGCQKNDDGDPVTIASTNLVRPKPGILTGTFIATGAFNTSGTQVMNVVPLGTDSIHCTLNCTAREGTFTIEMKCEKPPMMNGAWKVTGGTGAYKFLRGSGSLIMSFPPDPLVPPGAISVETMTGIAWLHP